MYLHLNNSSIYYLLLLPTQVPSSLYTVFSPLVRLLLLPPALTLSIWLCLPSSRITFFLHLDSCTLRLVALLCVYPSSFQLRFNLLQWLQLSFSPLSHIITSSSYSCSNIPHWAQYPPRWRLSSPHIRSDLLFQTTLLPSSIFSFQYPVPDHHSLQPCEESNLAFKLLRIWKKEGKFLLSTSNSILYSLILSYPLNPDRKDN